MSFRLQLLADIEPNYTVWLPEGRETWHQAAAPICLSLAVITGGLWLARRKAISATTQRILFLISSGSLACAYTARWIWEHRFEAYKPPTLDAIAADEMPFVWLAFCLGTVLVCRWRHRNARAVGAVTPETLAVRWRLLGFTMLVGVACVLVIVPFQASRELRMDNIPALLCTLILWGIIISYYLEIDHSKFGWYALPMLEAWFILAMLLLGLMVTGVVLLRRCVRA